MLWVRRLISTRATAAAAGLERDRAAKPSTKHEPERRQQIWRTITRAPIPGRTTETASTTKTTTSNTHHHTALALTLQMVCYPITHPSLALGAGCCFSDSAFSERKLSYVENACSSTCCWLLLLRFPRTETFGTVTEGTQTMKLGRLQRRKNREMGRRYDGYLRSRLLDDGCMSPRSTLRTVDDDQSRSQPQSCRLGGGGKQQTRPPCSRATRLSRT